MPLGMSVTDRFIQFFKKTEGCWMWLSGCNAQGYGQFWFNGGVVKAHRMSYEIFVGRIPEGKLVLHKCDTPGCVNPDHLFMGSHQDNIDDMRNKKRDRFNANVLVGSERWNAKFVEETVLKIFKDPRTQAEIAKEYQIDPSVISRIKGRKRWKHILGEENGSIS